MGKVRTILLQKGVFDDNNSEADKLREELRAQKTFLINVMSSPGAGKTTTLVRLINRLKQYLNIGVMEADIDYDIDAVRVADKTGCKSIQLHTGGMCHLDACMTKQGIDALEEHLDLIFSKTWEILSAPRSLIRARISIRLYSPSPKATTSRLNIRLYSKSAILL